MLTHLPQTLRKVGLAPIELFLISCFLPQSVVPIYCSLWPGFLAHPSMKLGYVCLSVCLSQQSSLGSSLPLYKHLLTVQRYLWQSWHIHWSIWSMYKWLITSALSKLLPTPTVGMVGGITYGSKYRTKKEQRDRGTFPHRESFWGCIWKMVGNRHSTLEWRAGVDDSWEGWEYVSEGHDHSTLPLLLKGEDLCINFCYRSS